jgi:hypothetical protein
MSQKACSFNGPRPLGKSAAARISAGTSLDTTGYDFGRVVYYLAYAHARFAGRGQYGSVLIHSYIRTPMKGPAATY